MSWITIVWSMNGAGCLTLAAIYFVVWCKQRSSWMYLAFSCSAAAGAALTAFELTLLQAHTIGQYSAVLRWAQFPVWTLVVSLVIFARLYFRAGRPWLAWSVCGLRTLALILNFILVPNLSYRKITSLRQVSWWGGETVSAPVGVTNPWIFIAQLSSLLLIVFFLDVTITVWRQGKVKRVLGVVLSLFSLIATGQALLVVWGIIPVPFLACFAILGLLVVMGYELSNDIFRAGQLGRELEVSQAALRKTEQAMEIAANAVGLALWTWDIASDEIWLSHKARAVFGFSPLERLDTERIRSFIHPEDREFVRKAVRDSLQTGAENPVEYRVVLPNGEIRWLVRRSRTEFDHNGKPVLMHGILFDITGRKQAELQAQQQRNEVEELRREKTALLEREVAERARLEREVIDICAREQRRIAYDLHDSVGQQLVGIALCAKMFEEELRGERHSEADKAGILVKLANDAAREVRLTARALEGADGVGDLKTALKSLATSVGRDCSVKATVTAEGSSFPISPPVAAQLYRIAQEAVHNAVEHGAAREVHINLAFNNEVMVLTIRDNGKGFDSNANGNGMGLRIMRYRAQCIGGSCDVQSSSEGTVVRCRVPLQADGHVRLIP